MQTTQVNGREIKYRLSQGNSREHVTLKFLSEEELEIILPKGLTVDIEALLRKKASLIERKRSEYIRRQRIPDGQKEATQDNKLLFFGKFYDLEINKSGEDYNISLEDQKLRIRMPKSIKAKDVEYEYLRKWIRNRLREILHDLLRFYTREMEASANKIYIKNQKTRWASHSPKNNINFNIKLAAIPKNIVEYVVIHELAHNTHRNHGKKFWFTVSKFCPDYKSRKQDLEKYSLRIQKNKIWQRMLQIRKTARAPQLESKKLSR